MPTDQRKVSPSAREVRVAAALPQAGGSRRLPRPIRRAAWVAVAVAVLAVGGKVGLEAWLRRVDVVKNLPAWITQRPIIHRGLTDPRAGAPENSMPAFGLAAEAGYPIELDVHLLADGRLAVIHDFNLKRMTGDARDVEQCTAADIQPLRLQGTDHHIPLLEEVLEMVRGSVPLLIEIKNRSRDDRRLEMALAGVLARYSGPVAVQSFNPYSLRWFRKHAPGIPRGQLASDFEAPDTAEAGVSGFNRFALRHLLACYYSRPAFISYDVRALPAWAASQKRQAGLPVIGWTVHSPAELAQAKKYCDNVVFDGFRPDYGLRASGYCLLTDSWPVRR